MDYRISLATQLSSHLKSLRSQQGLSQAALGKLLGVGQVRIANIENNPGAVSLDQMLSILHLLGCGLSIYKRDENKTATDKPDNDTTPDW
ncbi:helix-turn-helix domain-containing protein [Undibacterium sp. KW1]|uniref:helix-turn-helix domain-containing protein n=1 Tax=Undibacterium sp. KW1 TaxID=2058624 RepID=UPI0013897A26|nr:helix-turn-helix domain-containing protein [Undibacterium sp. KW1]